MAKKKRARDIDEVKEEIKKSLGPLEVGIRGLGDVSKDLTKVQANLRKFLDQAEKVVSAHPRLIPRPRRPKT
jgi:hypothetical protein